MPLSLRLWAATVVPVILLSACGDETISDLGYREVRAALTESDDPVAALKPFAGTRVRWSGTVVRVEKSFEDDFVEVARVLVDLDQQDPSAPVVADVAFGVSPKRAADLPPGHRITFVGKIRELEQGASPPRLLLEATIDDGSRV